MQLCLIVKIHAQANFCSREEEREEGHCKPQIAMHHLFNEQEVEFKKKKNTQHKEAGGLNPDSNQPPFSRLLFTAGHPATIERQMTNAELLQPRELRAKLRGVSEPEGSRFPSPAHPFPSLPRAFLRARSGWSAGRTCHKTPPNPRTPNRRAPRSSPS